MRYRPTDETKLAYRDCLKRSSTIVRKCANGVIGAFRAVQTSYAKDSPGEIALLLLLRHVTESIDAVAVVVASGCAQTCKPLLRSALEGTVSIAYILEKDSEQRGLAYLYADLQRSLKFFRECDPKEKVGKAIRSTIGIRTVNLIRGRLTPAAARKNIKKLLADINSARFATVHQEWQRMRALRKTSRKAGPCQVCGRKDPPLKNPEWYSLFGGPTNIEHLAKNVRLDQLYEVLYRSWSGYAHGGSTLHNLGIIEGAMTIQPIRDPRVITTLPRLAALISLPVARCVISKYAPRRFAGIEKRNHLIMRSIQSLEATIKVG